MTVLGVVSVAAETLACVDVTIARPFTRSWLLLLSRAQYHRQWKLSCVLLASLSSWQKKVLRWH